MTVPYALDYWINKGFPPNKIVLGFATYGRAFGLKDANNNGLGAPNGPKPSKGKYTREAGFLSYYEICNAGYTVVKHKEVAAPYGYKNDQWVSFDDADSMKFKVQKEIKGNAVSLLPLIQLIKLMQYVWMCV